MIEIRIKLNRTAGGGMNAQWLIEPTITNAQEVEYAQEIERAFQEACDRVARRPALTPAQPMEPAEFKTRPIGNG